jgi:hypothetical protein
VAAVHLKAGEVRWRGAAAEPSLLPGLGGRAPSAPWPELLAHWGRVVERLTREYGAGASAVDPLPGACLFCQLPSFCRVDASRRYLTDPDAEASSANENDTDGR